MGQWRRRGMERSKISVGGMGRKKKKGSRSDKKEKEEGRGASVAGEVCGRREMKSKMKRGSRRRNMC